MEITSYAPGTPNWVDVGVPDIDAAVAFYGELFGWTCPEGLPEFGGYRVCHIGGKPVAGIGQQQAPGPPYWSVSHSVVDVDATKDLVLANNGQVLAEPMDVGSLGRMAVLMDPMGAIFTIWQPGDHIGSELVNEPGTFSWSELMTTDIEASKVFYREVFGWEARTSENTEMEYTEFLLDGRSLAGMLSIPPMAPSDTPPNWTPYFAVHDTDAAIERIESLGGSKIMGPMDIAPGRFAVVADPAGAIFEIIALAQPDTA